MSSVTNKSAPITPVAVAQSYRFVVGVDTHAATHSYAVLDAAGALVDEQTFGAPKARSTASWSLPKAPAPMGPCSLRTSPRSATE